MAGRAKRAGGRGSPATRSSTRGSGRGGRRNPTSHNNTGGGGGGGGGDDDIPQVYHEMLFEVRQSASTSGLAVDERGEGRRAVKRRRIGESSASRAVPGQGDGVLKLWGDQKTGHGGGFETAASDKPVQTVYDVDASEESAMEWEDVDLAPRNAVLGVFNEGSSSAAAADGAGVGESLQLTLGNSEEKAKQKAAVQRRKPATALERKWRLDIHKVHILCLLSHVQMRNSWCNDEEAQVGHEFLVQWPFFMR